MRIDLEIIANKDRRAARMADRSLPRTQPWLREKVDWFLRRTNLTMAALASSGVSSRCPRTTRGRELLSYLLRHWPAASGIVPSFPEIGRAMGKSNHTTVITAYRRALKPGKRNRSYRRTDLDAIDPAALVEEAKCYDLARMNRGAA